MEDHLQARLIALELLFRAMLAGMVSKAMNPIGEIDRMQDEFTSSATCLRFGTGDDHAERMRELVAAFVASNFDSIRSRVTRDAEIEAAQAGRKN